MPSLSFSAEASPKDPAFRVPEPKIGRITRIEIDNASTNGAITIFVRDRFVPTPSLKSPNPVETTETRKVITVPQDQHKELDDLSLPIYGDCWISASRDDNDVSITIDYELE